MVIKNHPQKRTILSLLLIFVALVAAVYLNFSKSSDFARSEKDKANTAQKVLAAINVTQNPTPTPTQASPSATPTATPVPQPTYTGYCMNIPILLYHHLAPASIAKAKGFSSLNVDNGVFDQQMGYISSHGYNTIFAEDLINALKNHQPLPSKSILITIDDGYDDQYTYAYQILKKYHLKASYMIPTGLMGVSSGTNSYFSWDQLQEMVSSGLIRGNNHTFSHFSMGSKDAAKDQFEVSTAQQQLKDHLGVNNTVFAYPYGTNATSAKEKAVLEQNGISGAFSTISGSYQCDSFIFSLHRIRIGGIFFPAYGLS